MLWESANITLSVPPEEVRDQLYFPRGAERERAQEEEEGRESLKVI